MSKLRVKFEDKLVRQNFISYIVAVAARWTKSVKFTLSIAVHTGDLAKNLFQLVATHKKENWRTTKLFLKRVLNPFHEQKIKENFFRRKVERTALSKSGTLISISNSQLLVRVFAFFEVLQTVCVCFFECSKLGGKCNFNSLKSFYFSRSISKLSKQIYISYFDQCFHFCSIFL